MASDEPSDRSTIRDLVAVTALPAVWVGHDIPEIVASFVDAAMGMLRLDMCYVRITPDDRDRPITAARRRGVVGDASKELEPLLAGWLSGEPPQSIVEVENLADGAAVRFVFIPFGIKGEHGTLAAGSVRRQFPTDPDRLLLSVAANLAVMSIRSAHARHAEHAAVRDAEEATEIVETINRIGRGLAGQTDLQALVQSVTDEATRLTGAQFGAFFYNIVNEQGEAYMLYTLSGAPREAFEKFPLPRNTALFAPTFRGEGIVRIDDVKKDPRFGRSAPHYGMPSGHLPVTSYLAVPVVSRSGEVIGGLFFGHEKAGMFSSRIERIMAGVAAQTAIAIDNARLFEQEQRASRAKDEFLAILSHELRTPLNAVYGWARMLRSGQIEGEAAMRALDVITRNANAQVQLIDDLLDVSRITSGKMRLDVRALDLKSVIEAAIDSVQPAADAKGVRLQHVLDPRAVAVTGDPNRLQQVVWNLLVNAVKFTPTGGRVQVHLRRIDSHVEIVVSDTGQGITRELLPHIFERFRQADSTSTRAHRGLGLGLALVRHLVELHGGAVTAQSGGEGQGATFVVKLPVAIVQPDEKRAARAHPTAGTIGMAPSAPSLIGLRVAVVDDDQDSRDLIQAILVGAGGEIRLCESAADGLRLVEEWRPDVLISDIEMPAEDGYAFIGKVRALDPMRGGKTPAIALTAYGRVEDRVRTLSAGYNMHVPKPVDPTELVTVVANLAGRW